MSFLTKIKFGNITNLADARFAAAAGMDYMGFCFEPTNANYIPPIKAKEIMDWTTGSHIVAEFGHQSVEEINTISELLQVDVIEVNNTLLPDELKELDKAIIKKIDISLFDKEGLTKELEAYQPCADVFHLYTSDNSKETFDSEQLIKLCAQYKIIWGLYINAANAISIIDTYKPYAINVSGGMEEKTGIKDFDELNDFFDVIRVDD
jgi:phosphoribosylanthranilate isomerase